MRAIEIMVLWTWGLTPLWVNIVGTVLIGLSVLVDVCEDCKKRKY